MIFWSWEILALRPKRKKMKKRYYQKCPSSKTRAVFGSWN
jgi:hypothetical protein